MTDQATPPQATDEERDVVARALLGQLMETARQCATIRQFGLRAFSPTGLHELEATIEAELGHIHRTAVKFAGDRGVPTLEWFLMVARGEGPPPPP